MLTFQVIYRYLKRVELANDQAENGQKALDLLFARSPDYYSLILVSGQRDSASLNLTL